MEIKETNLQSAYNTADDNGKQMLRALFPEMKWIQNTDKSKLPVTERIKTFGDACYELGDKHPYVQDYLTIRKKRNFMKSRLMDILLMV